MFPPHLKALIVRALSAFLCGPVVQLVRTLACHARGQGFESPSGRQFASVAQSVEQRTENPRVVGSIPTGGTIYADLAHLVERDLAKVEVAGSSPVIRSKKEVTFVYQKLLLFLSKPQAWHIIAAQRAVHIIKVGKPTLYLITRQRAFPCGLMIYRNKLRMIYNSSGIDDIQGFALIVLRNYSIIY